MEKDLGRTLTAELIRESSWSWGGPSSLYLWLRKNRERARGEIPRVGDRMEGRGLGVGGGQ